MHRSWDWEVGRIKAYGEATLEVVCHGEATLEVICLLEVVCLSQTSEGAPDHDKSSDRNEKIGDRTGTENAVDAHKAGQDEQ